MDDIPYGAIEVVLAFGLLMIWGGWDLARNRRALNAMRNKAAETVRQRTG